MHLKKKVHVVWITIYLCLPIKGSRKKQLCKSFGPLHASLLWDMPVVGPFASPGQCWRSHLSKMQVTKFETKPQAQKYLTLENRCFIRVLVSFAISLKFKIILNFEFWICLIYENIMSDVTLIYHQQRNILKSFVTRTF